MMNIEDFRNMFRAHLSHEIWDKWRKGQLDVSMRRNTPDGCEYEELPKEAADQILDGGEIHSCEDLADPTEVISDRYACSLYGITTFKPSEYAIEEDFPNEVVLLVRGWSVADFMSDWTKLNASVRLVLCREVAPPTFPVSLRARIGFRPCLLRLLPWCRCRRRG